MTQQERDTWTQALRSGQYKQGKGALKTSRSLVTDYCCIGVWCMVNNIPISKGGSRMAGEKDVQYKAFLDSLDSHLAISIRDMLMHHNDGSEGYEQWDFNQIADYIEKEIIVTP